jgi:hypothetical protein
MINHDELFIGTMRELRQRISSNNKYDYIKACGLLRLLLMDSGQSLFILANKNRNLELLFHVSDIKNGFGIGAEMEWRHLFSDGKQLSLKISKFLKVPMLFYKGHCFDVADIIRYGANIQGGVHAGRPKIDPEKTYAKLEEIREHFIDVDSASIHSICEVVIEALEPLESAILGHPYS